MEQELQQVRIERYSAKKIKQYEAEGTPYQLIKKSSCRKCFVIGKNAGINHDHYCIQEEYYKDGEKCYRLYDTSDLNDYLIWTGGIDIEDGDLIRYSFGKSAKQREKAFYYFNSALCRLDGCKNYGFSLHWGIDYSGGQLQKYGTFHEITDEYPIYVAKATDEEIEQYKTLLAKNKYFIEEDGRIVRLPNIGECIYLIECKDGEFFVSEHKVVTEDDYRLLKNKFAFLDKHRAELVASRMLEVGVSYVKTM